MRLLLPSAAGAGYIIAEVVKQTMAVSNTDKLTIDTMRDIGRSPCLNAPVARRQLSIYKNRQEIMWRSSHPMFFLDVAVSLGKIVGPMDHMVWTPVLDQTLRPCHSIICSPKAEPMMKTSKLDRHENGGIAG